MVSLSPHVIFKFDRWLCETTGHLLYAISSFVDHFVAIGEFKLELQSGNGQFGSKSSFVSPASLKFDRWHRKIIAHPLCATSSFVHHFVVIGEFKLELQPGNAPLGLNLAFYLWWDLEIWQMTLKNNTHKVYATSSFVHRSFRSHQWIQPGITIRERRFVSNLAMFFWPVPSWK